MIEHKILSFKRITDGRGDLTPLENPNDIPFEIKRIYYIYNVNDGVTRGFHTHRNLLQVLIAANGSIDIKIKTPEEEKVIKLDSPDKGLLIGPMIWREMHNFSENSVLLVLASEKYDENDYIRDYSEYEEEWYRAR